LQVYPSVWESVLECLVSEYLCFEGVDYQKISVLERLNFEFSYERYGVQIEAVDLAKNVIVKTDERLFSAIKGSVIPSRFWDSYDTFEKSSIGFSLVDEKGHPLSTAFCSFISNGQLELGIETDSHYSGKGYAYAVCSTLLEYCKKQNLVPVWACSSANIGSQKLAQKLGFSIAKKRPYYQLPYTKEF
ncbi:MAG: GNAT family N-acetyltransferase, partial [Sulfurospirillaceae bacterium]|nr:GNAT family N-acetyltransferase [Sulfurospirillaceae bacterium]